MSYRHLEVFLQDEVEDSHRVSCFVHCLENDGKKDSDAPEGWVIDGSAGNFWRTVDQKEFIKTLRPGLTSIAPKEIVGYLRARRTLAKAREKFGEEARIVLLSTPKDGWRMFLAAPSSKDVSQVVPLQLGPGILTK